MKKSALLLCLLFTSVHTFAAPFLLESSAFQLNSMIPQEFTCNGVDKSPPLVWQNIPANTQSLALVVNDPDAPNGTWNHWILFNIPPAVNKLDAGTAIPQGAAMAKNSWGNANYQGPCPEQGAHRYVFTLFALDKTLALENGVDKDKALDAMTGHVIGSAEFVGLYQK